MLSAFLLSGLGKHLKILSCHVGKMSHFYFQQAPALRWVKHNKADICIPELAPALPKLQLTNYLCGVVWKWKVVSAAPDSVIKSCLCQPQELLTNVCWQWLKWKYRSPCLKMRKSSSSSEASTWKTMIYLFDGERNTDKINRVPGHFQCSSSICLWICTFISKIHIFLQ